MQLETAAEVLGHARSVLENLDSPPTEARFAAARLAEFLSDVMRVAESCGMSLSFSVADDVDASLSATE